MTAYAHSLEGKPVETWEPLAEHLEKVAKKAREFGADLLAGGSAAAYAEALGWLHDAGKYAPAFQAYIQKKGGRTDHSTAGAILARELYGAEGLLLAYAVAGHHAGLPDGGDAGESHLLRRCADASLADPSRDGFAREVAGRLPARLPRLAFRDMFGASMMVRMLFSCLTDADALSTEAFVRPEQAALRGAPPIGDLLAPLRAHLDARSPDPTPVNRLRADVLARCREAAALPPGFFSLTVPTGGGKTLSSLAFALEHAQHNELRRVVYVIPYLSIIEQTAEVFRRAFEGIEGAVVEHHSAHSDPEGEEPIGPDRHRLAAENWDAPVVVTTAVQFFESLFAARPSKCRKLHNLARAVVVLDEAQMLPVPHLLPCVEALRHLVEAHGATVLLCTATPPALLRDRPLRWGLDPAAVRPIVPDPEALHGALRRVRVRRAGLLDDAALVDRLAGATQALCIVETRVHAADLHRMLAERGIEGRHHLSANMCAAHRAEVLAAIRAELRDGRPCRVVSTQLVEAGVDVDFPLVLRASAGLDSVVQSAGRCNREGRMPEPGTVEVFDTRRRPRLSDLARRRDIGARVMARAEAAGEDPLSPATVERYFAELFATEAGLAGGKDESFDRSGAFLSVKPLQRPHIPFRSIAERFHLIDEEQVAVLTPRGEEAWRLAEVLSLSDRPGPLARRLQRHTVSVPRSRAERLCRAGTIRRVGAEGQFLLLNDRKAYDPVLGLVDRDPIDREAEENIH
jgi:CRISPR-associated endonuclease/helicase Cas3